MVWRGTGDGGAGEVLRLLRAAQVQVAPAGAQDRAAGVDLRAWWQGSGRAAAVPVRVTAVRPGAAVRGSSRRDPPGTVDLVAALGSPGEVHGWLRPSFVGAAPTVPTGNVAPSRLGTAADVHVLLDAALWLAVEPPCGRCGEHTVPYVEGLPGRSVAAAATRGWCVLGGCMPTWPAVAAVCPACSQRVDADGRAVPGEVPA